MAALKVLVIDDEASLREVVGSYLKHSGFEVVEAKTGRSGLDLFLRSDPDFIVLDLMLPDMTGEELCRTIRRRSQVPILMLTAKVTEEDKLKGFELGADDYLTKPFSPRELMSRIKAILKRTEGAIGPGEIPLCTFDGQISLSPKSHLVCKGETALNLTPAEFELLSVFLKQPGQVLSRLQLSTKAFGDGFEGFERTVDVHIRNLRSKIEENPKVPRYIETVFGYGYRLREGRS